MFILSPFWFERLCAVENVPAEFRFNEMEISSLERLLTYKLQTGCFALMELQIAQQQI